ncbi:uncharacterized protein UTRI_01912_B [Ustilago trichophora]|uniref:Uncharacterized protein n=1 Tax=Ustilago trichophora TaxID=86804 RepID=A0A5C3DUF7_9BASI|nr:uncharacterized protein UTRI_01912_B [Ustilago trichophora]
MMLSPPSSPSVLASTSRHNIIQPQHPSQHHQQKSLRLFLGHQSDEEAGSDCDFAFHHDEGEDSDSDESSFDQASGSRLQPGRLPRAVQQSPTRRAVSIRAYDDNDGGIHESLSPTKRQVKRLKTGTGSKNTSIFALTSSKQQAAATAAIPTTPTKRQKGFLVRGNVTPSRAFSIFRAAKQRSQQRQQHGLMTPPTSSPLRPIILDSFDDLDDHIDTSPSQNRIRPITSISSPSSSRCVDRPYTLTHSSQKRSATISTPSRLSSSAFKPSAFAGGVNSHPSLPQALHSLRTRQPLMSSNGLLTTMRHFSAARTSTIDTTSFLETFVSPSSCVFQISRSSDDEILSHPISAAYSYSSRSVNPSAQWLAVGDDEGRITLLNTLPWQDESAEQFASNPQWQASSSSAIFEVVWRFDDRAILSGASDFSIRSWDTEYQKCTAEFEGHTGSPRTIVYDPTTNGDGGCGMVFASAGRDGTIRIWDARASSRGHVISGEGDEKWVGVKPVLTIDAAHSTVAPAGAAGGLKGRKQQRNGAVGGGRGRKKLQQQPLPAGITALSYLPDGQGHKLLSGGSANGIIKCWDLRHVRQSQPTATVSQVDTQEISRTPVSSTWQTPDLSLLSPASTTGLGSFRRAHGISQIISSSTSLYASCTGGKIYSLPLSTFLDSHLTQTDVQTLYDPVQCQNTLFSRMALFDDRFLAVGCNTGNVALWDVTTPRSQSRMGDNVSERDTEEERRAAREMEAGFAHRSQQQGMAVLTEGHAKNTEVNAVAWANGPNGPTLSSVGDDTKIRTWFADRGMRGGITQAACE